MPVWYIACPLFSMYVQLMIKNGQPVQTLLIFIIYYSYYCNLRLRTQQ